MSDKLQLRRGTTAQHASFIGSEGEVTVDTDDKELVLHDGITPGGKRQASKQSVLDLIDVVAGNKEDLELESISTEPDFKGRIEANRRKFAGSGFVEWGKHRDSVNEGFVNEGFNVQSTSPNELRLGRRLSDGLGTSLSPYPIVNVDGVLAELNAINGTDIANVPLLPPAPDGLDKADGTGRFADLAAAIAAGGTALNASVINRQDLVGTEVWYEAMSTNDVFHPYGNTQFGVSTYDGISLTNSFIAQSYSAFGEWDTNTVGYHKQWSDMSATEKALALSDYKNNLFFSRADNDYIQVKYRIRSIKGLGPEWEFVDVTTDGYLKFSLGANGNGVLPRGEKTSAQDFVGSDSALAYYASKSSGLNLDNQEHAAFTIRNDGVGGVNPEDYAHEGKCYFLPIALVSRRNQGAYHDTLNKNGTRTWNKDSTWSNGPWYVGDITSDISLANCMRISTGNPATNDNLGAFIDSGYIGASFGSGRPDGKFYDAIYEGDVEDLRISARRKAKSDLREEFKRKAIANEVRGFETESQWEVVSSLEESGTTGTGAGEYVCSNDAGVNVGDFLVIQCGSDFAYGYAFQITGGKVRVGWLRSDAFASQYGDVTTAGFKRTNGATTTIYRLKGSLNFKELLQCDVIGDPANYYSGQTYTNTGATQVVTVNVGDVVFNNGASAGGTVGHYYRRLTATGSTSLDTHDYSDTVYWADLGTTYDGQTWTNDGSSQVVDILAGDVIYNNGSAAGGEIGHYYTRGSDALGADLSLQNYSNYIDLGRKYRGQQWTNDGASQSVNLTSGDVVYQAVTPVNGGTAGHFYARIGNTTGTDLAFTDYTNDTIWTDLGPDWNESAAAGSWLQDGIPGFPLLTHADTGASLIPDGTSKSFKMSRKVSESVLGLISNDNGVTWSTFDWSADLESSSNARTASLTAGQITLNFYLTDAHFTEESATSKIDSIGDTYLAVSDNRSERGGALASSLIGKVTTEATAGGVAYDNITMTNVPTTPNFLVESSDYYPKGGLVTLRNPDGSPAVKVLDYLSHENGRYYLNLLGVELGWDTAKDATAEFTDINSGTGTKTAGEAYHITDTQFEGYWLWTKTATSVLAGNEWFEENGNLYFDSKANGVYAVRWDGTGWGDDKEFSVIGGTDVKTDLNGNVRLVTQQRFALPYLTGEDS